MKIIYEVRGMMEWHPVFRIGRTRLQIPFTGGNLCGGATSAASFETSDPVVQTVIEKSAPFRSGRICIGMVMEDVQPDRRSDKPRAERIPNNVMEVENYTKASDFLQYTKGVPLERILTSDQCVAEAKKLGIDLIIKG